MSISQTVSYAQNFSALPRFDYIAVHNIAEQECTSYSACSAHRGTSLGWKKVQGDAASDPRATAVVQFVPQLQEFSTVVVVQQLRC